MRGDLCHFSPVATLDTMTTQGKKSVILITGSEGFIGDAIVRSCCHQHEIAGFDVARPHKDPEAEDFINCDLTSDASVGQALDSLRQRHGSSLASVVHLAAFYDFSGKPNPLYQDLTVEGTRRLLKRLQSFDVEQFVFSSTHLVMKPSQHGEPITEVSAAEAAWDYPKSKLEAEKVIASERRRIPAVILRIAGVYDENCHVVPIAQQVSRIYQKELESYLFPGEASHGQAFVHLDDVVDCILRAIERRRDLAPYEVFLVAEPDLMSYAELQDRLGELIHGEEWPTIRVPKVVAKAGAWAEEKLAAEGEETFIKPWMIDLADDHYPIDIARARQKLGWEPKHRLRDTLGEMVARLKRDPKRWYQINGLPTPEHLQPETADLNAIAPPWNYNPSAWSQRIPLCVLALVATLISLYMALYQWRVIDAVWDPVFGAGTHTVLDSDVSERIRKWLRIPDAALGAVAYLSEVIFGLAGSTRRWQYRPWLVLLFGFDVIPLGIVSAVLVVLQGAVVGAWCLLCLATAAISLLLIYFAYDEVWSSLLYLRRVWRKTHSQRIFWDVFWGRAVKEADEVALDGGSNL